MFVKEVRSAREQKEALPFRKRSLPISLHYISLNIKCVARSFELFARQYLVLLHLMNKSVIRVCVLAFFESLTMQIISDFVSQFCHFVAV